MDEDYGGYESYDPHDSMPFGDAIRFEENLLASKAGQEFSEEVVLQTEYETAKREMNYLEDFFDDLNDHEEWDEDESNIFDNPERENDILEEEEDYALGSGPL